MNVTSKLRRVWRRRASAGGTTPWGAIAAIAWSLLLAPAARAQATPGAIPKLIASSAVEAPPLQFRRVFVPAERTADWPTGGAQYLPMERAEFERLAQQAEERRQLGQVGKVQLVEAAYVARLTEGDLLEGSATFDVKLIDERPAILSLDHWAAVVLRGRWLGEDEADDATPATLGLWPREEGESSSYGLLVERSGTVELEWQAAPQRRGEQLEFLLRLPTAASQAFTLDLPAGVTPAISSGRVVEQAVGPQAASRRWTFQLAAGAEHLLQLTRAVAANAKAGSATSPLTAITEAYHLTPDGADYEAELRVQQRGTASAELRLEIPPTLHIGGVSVNRQPVKWRRDAEDAKSLVIPLPAVESADASGSLAVVAISGAAAMTFDAPWLVPSVVPQGVFWTEGTSTLWVDPSLEVRSLIPRECSLLNVVGVGVGAAGEVYRLQAWTPSASAELIVGDRRESLRYRSAIAVEFAERDLAASASLSLWGEGGRTFHLSVPLADDWSIESIVSAPVDDLAEWHVEEGEARRLHLQLRRSPTVSLPLRLTVNARKPWRAWTRTASVAELDLLQLPGIGEARWLQAKDRRGNEVIPGAKLAEAVAPAADLPDAVRELFGEVTGGLLINLNDATSDALVSVASTPVTFAGEAWMEVSHLAAGYEHRAEILCRPASGAVSELRLLAARGVPTDAVWELKDGTPLTVERVSPAVVAAPASAPGAVAGEPIEYRVRLPQQASAPFRMRVSWRSTAAADAAVNLLSLPDAQSWQAWAIFRGLPNHIGVEARGAAIAVALPPQTAADELPAIACFRLGDDPTVKLATPPAFVPLVKNEPGGAPASGVIAWQCDVVTEQLADGTQNHRLVYAIEAREPTEVQLTVPPSGASFTSVELEGRGLIAAPVAEARTVRFRLPGAAKVQRLTVALQRKTPPLGRRAKIWPALPRTSFPIVEGSWTLRWPAAYEAVDDASNPRTHSAGPAKWLFRLFGPLSGHDGHRWYDGMLLAHVEAAPANSANSPAAPGGPASPGGWDLAIQSFVNRPVPVELRLASGVQANWHLAWLISAVAAGWIWARSRRAAMLLMGVVAVVCLVVPEPLIPLPQAMFLGLATGVVVRQLVSFLTKPRASVRRRPAMGSVATLSWGVAVAAAVWPCAAKAQTPVAALNAAAAPAVPESANLTSSTSPPAVPPQVLFPVDDEGEPAGADVYVPAAMAAELLPAAAGPGAALVDARYQIEIQPVGANGELAVREARLRFRWKSGGSQLRVQFPLVAADGAIDPASLLLNGQPVSAVWNEQGTALSLVLPQPGEHELTATFNPMVPIVVDQGQRARLQLHIPRVSGATVEIVHPAGVSDVRVAGAIPSVSESSAARSSFRLGAVGLLDASWPARIEREAAGVAVQQLSVLQVDPVAARVEVRLRLSGDAAGAQTFRVVHSPQLKLLPLPEGSPLEIVGQPGDAAAPTVVELRFSSPPALPLTLALQFQFQRSLSVGRIEYPWVDMMGMNVRSRHFVVVADARLRVRDAATAGLTPVAAAELESLWSGASVGASLQYAAAMATPEWSLDVAPSLARFTPHESLEIVCSERDVRFHYSALLAEIDGELLVHRFVVPTDATIDLVAAAEEGTGDAIPIRWSRPQPDQLQLFLSRPLSEPHSIRMEGRLNDAITAAPAGEIADAGLLPVVERHVQVPRIGLEAGQVTPIDLRVYRTGDVLAEWSSPAPAAKPNGGPADRSHGLFVGQYSLPRGEAALPELKVVPNDAQYEADALLTLQLDSVEPTAECRLAGRALHGMVDRISLITGKNWRGPFVCDVPATIKRRELSGDSSRQLLDVRLARPIPAGESFELSIQGPASLEADQRIRFPSLQLANARKQRTFLILPPTAGNLTAEWTLRGLATQALPQKLAEKLGAEGAAIAYRVQRDRFVAEQRVFPDAMRKPAYRLAESRVSIGPDGAATVLSQLIVQAGGSARCRVSFPAGAELQYAAVDGAPQAPSLSGSEEWQAPPGSHFLPRVFLFSYRLPAMERRDARRFDPPQVKIDDRLLVPATSLWQIDGIDNVAAAEHDANVIAEGQFLATSRRKQIDSFLDAYPLASQIAPWELQLWRQPWLDRLSGVEASVAAGDPIAWTQLRDRLTAAKAIAVESPIDPVRQWSKTNSGNAAYFNGGADGSVTLMPQAEPWPIARWLAALTLAAVIGVAWRQPASLRNLALPAQRWPYAAIGLAGALWWWLLAPSLLGVLLIAFAVAAYVKSRR